MKHIIFTALVLSSVFKCTGARAESGHIIVQPNKTCERVVQDLRKIAWDDPDAYDFTNLKYQGTVKYMCYPGADTFVGYHVEGKPTNVDKLCIKALRERCK